MEAMIRMVIMLTNPEAFRVRTEAILNKRATASRVYIKGKLVS